MPHHFPKSTVEASAWCNRCGKMTLHRVFDGRLGRCKNEHPHPAPTVRLVPDAGQGELFGGER
jgi:hypothetical protein